MLHVLLWIGWCLVPALVLLPLRILDREPANETVHESGQDDAAHDDQDPILTAVRERESCCTTCNGAAH